MPQSTTGYVSVAGGLDPDQYRRFGFQLSVTRSSAAWWSAIMWFMVMISAAKPAVSSCFCNSGELWSGGTRVRSNNSRYRGRFNLTIMEICKPQLKEAGNTLYTRIGLSRNIILYTTQGCDCQFVIEHIPYHQNLKSNKKCLYFWS